MAERWAVLTGNWSNTATWNGGTLPGVSDDVYANGKTVTIDQSITVLSLRTTAGSTAIAGGGFTASSTHTVTANIISGTTVCLTFSGNSPDVLTIVGNITGGNSTNSYGLSKSGGTGNAIITGNVSGGTATNTYGIYGATGGKVTITGDVSAGSGVSSQGIYTVIEAEIFGNANGGSESSTLYAAIYNAGSATVTIHGNATGGSGQSRGAWNTSSGSIIITGNAVGGTGASSNGLMNTGTGTCYVNGNAIANNYLVGGVSNNIPGVNNTGVGNVFIGGKRFGPYGNPPTSGARIYLDVAQTNICEMYDGPAGNLVAVSDVNCDSPAASNVRAGIQYNNGNYTGTLAVPSPAYVALGVATDNTVGTLTTDQAALITAIAGVQSTANTIAAQTDTLEAGQTTIIGHVDTLESGQSAISSALGTLQTTANTIVAQTDTLESALGTLQADVDVITPPNGVYIVSIQAVAGAQIGVRALGFQWSYTTDAGGMATAHLGAGDYEIIGFAGGYIITPQTVTISDDATVTMTCTAVTLPASIDPALCACYIDLREAISNAVPSALPTDSRIRIKTNPAGTTADYSNSWTSIAADDFSAGRVTLELPRLSTVEFCIPGYISKSVITVPDEASANISGLFP